MSFKDAFKKVQGAVGFGYGKKAPEYQTAGLSKATSNLMEGIEGRSQLSEEERSQPVMDAAQMGGNLAEGALQNVQGFQTGLGPGLYSEALSRRAMRNVERGIGDIREEEGLRQSRERMGDVGREQAYSQARADVEIGRIERKRMERQQKRAARNAVIGSILGIAGQAAGAIAGTFLGAPGAGAQAGKALGDSFLPEEPPINTAGGPEIDPNRMGA
jgi:hypothetical protein